MSVARYDISGSGPDLLMVHGIGANRHVWDSLIEHLSPYFRCISYDLPGHGVSEIPPTPMTLEELVTDLERLQDALGITKAHVIGHSLGGMIGPAYARHRPDRVLSLGLLSTAAFRSPEDSAKVKAVVSGMRARSVAADLDVLNTRWFTDDFAHRHPEIIERRRQQVLDTDPDVFLNVFDIYAETEMSPWLSEIHQPALVLTGENDGGCNPGLNRQIATALPNSRLVILPDVKHAILLEAPDAVANELLAFWQANRMLPESAAVPHGNR